MRYLVISDIHANVVALETVLADAEGQWDKLWCLGDIVGYGPNPNECITLLRQHDHLSLSGNHDWAVLGRLDLDTFNADARSAIEWTRSVLTEPGHDYLEALESKVIEEPFTLVHASPRQPVWEYVLEPRTAVANFKSLETAYCLLGHTHVALVYERIDASDAMPHAPLYDQPIVLGGTPLLINPGSVGQPRDSDPRAAYGILDTEAMTWVHRRVAYDIEETQNRMSEAGLPVRLIARLAYGW